MFLPLKDYRIFIAVMIVARATRSKDINCSKNLFGIFSKHRHLAVRLPINKVCVNFFATRKSERHKLRDTLISYIKLFRLHAYPDSSWLSCYSITRQAIRFISGIVSIILTLSYSKYNLYVAYVTGGFGTFVGKDTFIDAYDEWFSVYLFGSIKEGQSVFVICMKFVVLSIIFPSFRFESIAWAKL